MSKKALLLVGSPKKEGSTSFSLGSYLMGRLGEAGMGTGTIWVRDALRSDGSMNEALAAMCSADIVVLSFPLYVDSLPSHVVRFMEEAIELPSGRTDRSMMAICNSGFPEPEQCGRALSICSIFAEEAGMRWLGGLMIGGGGMVNGKELDEAGGMLRKCRTALDMTARSLASGEGVPESAVQLTSGSPVPIWMYRTFSNMMWRWQARRNGTDLYARPLLQKEER